ncbi:hypothetical protein M0802_003800 [Mischocyttarus mexicanus]|nr:hypothetical protein M0802_003800 [Mischocyttarus mexicanus]
MALANNGIRKKPYETSTRRTTTTTTTTITTTKKKKRKTTSCGPVSLLESPLPWSLRLHLKALSLRSGGRCSGMARPPHHHCIPPIWVPTIGSEKCNGLNSRRGSYQGPWASPTRSPVQQPNF